MLAVTVGAVCSHTTPSYVDCKGVEVVVVVVVVFASVLLVIGFTLQGCQD